MYHAGDIARWRGRGDERRAEKRRGEDDKLTSIRCFTCSSPRDE